MTIGTPIPTGRGRWRVTLHRRAFTSSANAVNTMITELTGARSRRLELALNTPAKLTFTLDGRSPAAALINELQQDVWLWRWDEATGIDHPVFRGVVAMSEDVISEQVHVLNLTCFDYVAMFARRYLTSPQSWTNVNQDTLVQYLVALATAATSSSGVSLTPGSYLPLTVTFHDPAGATRSAGAGVPVRTRVYAAQSAIGELLDNLAHVQAGFDYAAVPVAATSPNGNDQLRIYFPQQGITRTDPVLEYGGALAGVTRSVNSSNYGNYVRVVGNNGNDDPLAPQLYAEEWIADANDIGRIPIGLWMDAENAPDVTDQATLTQQASGHLALSSVLVPSYSLTLSPGTYRRAAFNLGDTVPVVIKSGRLNVNTGVRIVGMNFAIDDDGDEDVELIVGRPLTSLADHLTSAASDITALARRTRTWHATHPSGTRPGTIRRRSTASSSPRCGRPAARAAGRSSHRRTL